MKKNNKGFTVVEMGVSFCLIFVIAILLFQILLTLKEVYINSDIKTTLLTKQAILLNKVYSDLEKKELNEVSECGAGCVKFSFNNGEDGIVDKTLLVNQSSKEISYDGYVWKLDNLSKIDSYDFSVQALMTSEQYIKLNVIITNELLEDENFGFNIVWKSDDEEVNLGENIEIRFTKNFAYTGGEQSFTVPYTGKYKLEVWGAQGGNAYSNTPGGYGGYSTGEIHLTMGNKLYINVGGQGQVSNTSNPQGGYNGGGSSTIKDSYTYISGGGGATHIATKTGLLSTLENFKNNILIVAGGGGGSYYHTSFGKSSYYNIYSGSGGGNIGETGKSYCVECSGINGYADGGTQNGAGTQGGDFGTFGSGVNGGKECPGGGGGFYGGNTYSFTAGGGSGYLNNNLTNKIMYMYCNENCTNYNSTNESTKTNTTTNVNDTPISTQAKKGNGYAKITYLSS